MDEIETALKLLKKEYLKMDEINDKTVIISKWIYILEKAYDILESFKED